MRGLGFSDVSKIPVLLRDPHGGIVPGEGRGVRIMVIASLSSFGERVTAHVAGRSRANLRMAPLHPFPHQVVYDHSRDVATLLSTYYPLGP